MSSRLKKQVLIGTANESVTKRCILMFSFCGVLNTYLCMEIKSIFTIILFHDSLNVLPNSILVSCLFIWINMVLPCVGFFLNITHVGKLKNAHSHCEKHSMWVRGTSVVLPGWVLVTIQRFCQIVNKAASAVFYQLFVESCLEARSLISWQIKHVKIGEQKRGAVVVLHTWSQSGRLGAQKWKNDLCYPRHKEAKKRSHD